MRNQPPHDEGLNAMTNVLPMLAQINISFDEAFGGWRRMSAGVREFLTIFGAIAFITLLAFIWAIFLRKRGKRRKARSAQSSQLRPATQVAMPPGQSGPGAMAPQRVHHRRRRRRRREHRPRNPTLADTGGLPPIRSEGPSDQIP